MKDEIKRAGVFKKLPTAMVFSAVRSEPRARMTPHPAELPLWGQTLELQEGTQLSSK